MAFSQVSTTHEDAVSAVHKTVQNEGGFDPAGAHDPDYPDVRRILEAGHARRVCCGVTTPVAQKAENSWLKAHVCFPLTFRDVREARLNNTCALKNISHYPFRKPLQMPRSVH